MKTPLFSIIIPAYNEEQNLARCLQSIADLDFPKERYEVIILDNGSTDRTPYIARSMQAKILVDAELNVAGLRNLGVRHSGGDVLAFVDADCTVDKSWLSSAARYAADQKVAVWGAPAVPPVNATWVQRTWFLVRKKEAPVQKVEWLETMNLFVRKDQFLAVGGFNEALDTCEDVDFCYRIRQYGEIISDSAIGVIHYGEAATLREFAGKEIWRGRGNMRGVISHGFSFKEFPSLAIPIYFGLLMPLLFLFAMITADLNWLVAGFVFLLLPGLAVMIRIRNKIPRKLDVLRLLALLQVYFFSRTIAVIKRT
jgi:glycosyltransferase involved in cell wall biosynthesis